MLVEREVGHQTFEPGVLLFHLPPPTQFAHTEVCVLLFSGVEGLLGNVELPTDIPNGSVTLGLPNGIHDLFFGEFRPLHRSTPFVEDRRSRQSTLVLECRRVWGRRHPAVSADTPPFGSATTPVDAPHSHPLVLAA